MAVESGAVPGAEPGAAAGGSVAWDLPATTRAYAAYRRGALRWLAGGLGSAAVAIALSAYAIFVLGRPGLGVFIFAAALLGIIALSTGGGGLIRAWRFRAALQRAPWQTAELRVVGAHLRLVFEDGRPDTAQSQASVVDARLMSTSRWRMREVAGHREGEVLVCPAQGLYVLSAQGMNNLYGLRPLREAIDRDRP